MEITAALVKELRERTGSGMLVCLLVLSVSGGDFEAAVELMRKTGMAKADKKAGRVAAEGAIVAVACAVGVRVVIVEVNCETDFVAKGDDFVNFSNQVAKAALAAKPASVDEVMGLAIGGGTVDEVRRALIAKLGENISVRRFTVLESAGGKVGIYLHGSRIGVLAAKKKKNKTQAKNNTMHVAASKPVAVRPQDVSADVIAKEKEIYVAQAADSGKPAESVEKKVMGRVRKFLSEMTLLGQLFVIYPDQTVEQLLKE